MHCVQAFAGGGHAAHFLYLLEGREPSPEAFFAEITGQRAH